MDIHRNELEQRKRENPEMDTTFDEMLIKHATKYLIVDPDDCCYLNKSNHFPVRMQNVPGTITPLVARARKVLQDKDLERQMTQLHLMKDADTRDAFYEEAAAKSVDSDEEVYESDEDDEQSGQESGRVGVDQSCGIQNGTAIRGFSLNSGSNGDRKEPGTNTIITNTTRLLVPPLLLTHHRKQQHQAQAALKAIPKPTVVMKPNTVSNLQRSHTTLSTVCLPTIAEARPTVQRRLTQSSDAHSRPPKSAHCNGTIIKDINYDSEDEEYDNVKIMHKLRKAGIIKDREIVDFENQQISEMPYKQRPRTSVRVYRKPLTLDMLKKESASIQQKLKQWFYDLEVLKKRERNQRLARQRLKKIEDAQIQFRYGTMNLEDTKKLNLMLSFRSKVMKEKWQNATAKMMLKSEGKSEPAPAKSDRSTANPDIDSTAQISKKTSKDPLQWKVQKLARSSPETPRYGKYTLQRSRRHSLTFKLRRMVEDVLANTTTYERMEYDKVRQNMKDEQQDKLCPIPESRLLWVRFALRPICVVYPIVVYRIGAVT